MNLLCLGLNTNQSINQSIKQSISIKSGKAFFLYLVTSFIMLHILNNTYDREPVNRNIFKL